MCVNAYLPYVLTKHCSQKPSFTNCQGSLDEIMNIVCSLVHPERVQDSSIVKLTPPKPQFVLTPFVPSDIRTTTAGPCLLISVCSFRVQQGYRRHSEGPYHCVQRGTSASAYVVRNNGGSR